MRQALRKGNAWTPPALWATVGCSHNGTAAWVIQYLWFSLVATATLGGSDLAFSQGLWVMFLGCWRGEVIWGRWLGTLWLHAKSPNQPFILTLALALRLVDSKTKCTQLSPCSDKNWRTNPGYGWLINVSKALRGPGVLHSQEPWANAKFSRGCGHIWSSEEQVSLGEES
jgi:hypothetical protein